MKIVILLVTCNLIFFVQSVLCQWVMIMKLQSAIEFLSTYGFLFVIMTAALLFIVSIITATKTTIPQQCFSYSVLNCNFVNYYINTTAAVPYALVEYSLTNAQEVPINITAFTTSIGGVNYSGGCAPDFLYPGQQATCASNLSAFLFKAGDTINAQFAVNALVCDESISALQTPACNANVIYVGSFVTTATVSPVTIFSVIAARGPPGNALSPDPVPPFLPAGYTPIQEGSWTLSTPGNIITYDYATQYYLPGSDFGISRQPFPGQLSSLNNNNIAVFPPYNSVFSYAYTIVYVPSGTTYTFNGVGDDGLTFFVKAANSLGSWTTTTYSGWRVGPAISTSYTCSCGPAKTKLVAIAVAWENSHIEGMQAVNIIT